ncbi:hypothetical protein SOVF_031530 [Spinacia oleracea]|uniref:Remorin C-terminal domain-containing protein n=1 Tax=Spinacia oleracea TaxID=3562 RepID=A0A9R0JWN0_SPIOL|nr:uncharacterized protein LOC110788975 [Spinacia oleracea]KNA22769.1 hypothetical protein SOVF_031530 [Spinacia oleracea]
MKVKTEESVSASKKKINHQSQVDEKESSGNKMFNKSSKLSNKAWSMSSLMEDLPLSASSSFNGDSPTLPCDSCRPSTVFYSPTRFQGLKNSNSFSNLKKQFESEIKNGYLGGFGSNEVDNSTATFDYESSVCLHDDNKPALYAAVSEECYGYHQHKKGSGNANCEVFEGAIPVIDKEQGERRLSHRPKSYQDFLDETRSHKQKAEIDAMRKASYTYLLRKLTKKEEAIDEWESSRKKKAELHLDKLERKLEQKRAEAVQKVHKKLAEAKQEAQERKAKARRSALKEMAKHCSQLT